MRMLYLKRLSDNIRVRATIKEIKYSKSDLKIGYLIGVKQRKRDTKYLPYMLREIIESKELYL